MNRRFFPGAWYIDALPSGEYCVLFPQSHIDTHLGPIRFPVGESWGVGYLRCTNIGGFALAGQAHDRNDVNYEWHAGDWHAIPTSYLGVSPVIYDRFGVLHQNDGSAGSQGYRYVTPENVLVTGDATYSSTFGLSQWTDLGDDLKIGQAQADDTHDAAWIWDGTVHRVLEAGPCTFIRAERDGDLVSLAYVKPDGAVLVQTTMRELRALPPIAAPKPKPQPTPIPEPIPMPDFNLKAEVAAERAKYPAMLTEDQPAKILNAVAWKHRADGWGLSVKPGGNRVPSPQGVDVAYDILHHKPSNRLFDALTGDLAGVVTWGETSYHGDPVNRPWLAPIAPGGVVIVPAPKPEEPKPAPPTVKVTYDQFVHHEAHEIRKAYAKRNGHDSMNASDLAHTFWRRLVERWTFRDVIHDILREPYEDGGMGGDR